MGYFGLVAGIVVLDQASKYYMSSILALCQPGRCETIEILPVFQLMLLHNPGAAFSFLADAGGWQRWLLLLISLVVSLIIGVWLHRAQQDRLLALALAFILGGALGNLVDRALHGYVVDFLLVHYQDWYFPAFNLADSAITLGAALLILEMFVGKKDTLEKTNA
ncbi:MAG: signal peptidase II [Pseudomonadota bacterium]